MNAREFLRSQGFEVGDRGRFSAKMKAALAANPDKYEEADKPASTPRVSIPKVKSPKVETVKSKADPKAVRAWAVKNNIPVGERGRIHPDVYASYEAAQTSAGEEIVERKAEGSNGTGEPAPQLHPNGTKWGWVDPKGKTWTFDNNATVCSNTGFSIGWCGCSRHTVLLPIKGAPLDLVPVVQV